MSNRFLVGVAAAIFLFTCALYSQTLGHDFINFDTPTYLWENDYVPNGLTVEGVKWAFTGLHASNWHPVTWLSHMLDVELFGMEPAGHHGVNVLFHAVNAVLILLFFWITTNRLWPATVVALLFAVHPAHVESVAWVAERKDVLSTFLMLLAMLAYVRYTRQPTPGHYLVVFVLTGLGLMAKPSLVTLPCVLLLLDIWPLERFEVRKLKTLLLEKVPLLALVGVSIFLTLQAQQSAMTPGSILMFQDKFGNAAVAYVRYVMTAVFPSDLALYYPHPGSRALPEVLGSIAFLSVVSLATLFCLRKLPFLFVGWAFFLGTLVPVIGLVQVGAQAWADRYTYIPYIGLFVIPVYGIAALASTFRIEPRVLAGGTAALVILYAGVTYQYLGHWQNAVTIWSRTLLITDPTYAHFIGVSDTPSAEKPHLGVVISYNNMATALYSIGLYEDSLRHVRRGIEMKPDKGNLYYVAGIALLAMSKREEALDAFAEAIRLEPTNLRMRREIERLIEQ